MADHEMTPCGHPEDICESPGCCTTCNQQLVWDGKGGYCHPDDVEDEAARYYELRQHMLDRHEEDEASLTGLMAEEWGNVPHRTDLERLEQIHWRQHDSLDWDAGHDVLDVAEIEPEEMGMVDDA